MSATAIGVCRLICHVCQLHHIWSNGEVPESSPYSQTVLQNREQSASPTACGHLLRGLPAPAFSETWVNSPQMNRPESRGQPLPRLGPSSQSPPGICPNLGAGLGNSKYQVTHSLLAHFNHFQQPHRGLSCYLTVTVKCKTCYYTHVTGGTHRFSNRRAHGWKGQGSRV